MDVDPLQGPGDAGAKAGPSALDDDSTKIAFQSANPMQKESKAWHRFEKYKAATTVGEAIGLGAERSDLNNDLKKNFMTITKKDALSKPDDETVRRLQAVKRNMTSPSAQASTPKRPQTERSAPTPRNMEEEAEFKEEFKNEADDVPATLSAIGRLLDQKLTPVSSAIEKLENQFEHLQLDLGGKIQKIRDDIRAEVHTMEGKISKLDIGLTATTRRLDYIELAVNTGEVSAEAARKFEKLQQQVLELIHQKSMTKGMDDRACLAVYGGFPRDADNVDAYKQWLANRIRDSSGCNPIEQFHKGDYKGIIWARFPSRADRDRAVESVRQANIKHPDGRALWARPDLPAEVRIPEGLLFGFKRTLVEWGFARSTVRVDTDTSSVKVGGELVLTVKIVGGRINCTWHGAWAEWADLHDSPELKDIVDKAQSAMQNAGRGTKGKGKGGERE